MASIPMALMRVGSGKVMAFIASKAAFSQHLRRFWSPDIVRRVNVDNVLCPMAISAIGREVVRSYLVDRSSNGVAVIKLSG
ncbi:hypothetical protein [Pseudomonas chlororaphis]|uniref:hypothetical protein n=1 Tax=Pseudomonas chlororaphis TaxID=587753 RepID=UPI001179C892|nr:hypothetical protein [Pseudomonas chlororaphis]